MRKLLSVILALTMIVSSVATVAFAAPSAINVETVEEVAFATEAFEEVAELESDDAIDTWDGTVDTSWYTGDKDEYVLTTAEQWAGFAYLVNGAQADNPAVNTKETADFGYYCGKNAPKANATSIDFYRITIKLGADLDFLAADANGEPVKLYGGETLSMMPVGYSKYTTFKGTFDGQGHTIKNLFQGGWDLYGFADSGDGVYLGLFGCVENAVIKNFVVDNFNFNCEMNLGAVAGRASGTSTFDNITIKNTTVPGSGGWWAGGLIGWAYGNQTISNISIDETNTVAQSGGHYDTAVGGIIGGCNNVDGESIAFINCDVACKLDVYNDCTANYSTNSYRNCGMLIGGIGEDNEILIDGKKYPDFAAKGLTFENVKVTFGEWANYTYCWSTELPKNCQRIEPGVGYKGVDLSKVSDYSIDTTRPFDAIFGAENAGDLNNVRGKVNLEVIKTLGNLIGLDENKFEVVDKAKEARSAIRLYRAEASLMAAESVPGYVLVDSFETLKDALAAAQDGDMLLLVADLAMDEPVVVEKDITLDLNGKTLSYTTDEAQASSLITNRATLTIKDETGTGKITMLATNPDTSSNPSYANNTITNCGILNITGGTVENATDAAGRAAYAIDNNSTTADAIVNISGGAVTAVRAIRQFANSTTYKNEVNIEGGEVAGSSYGIWTQNPGSGDPKASLNVEGGTVSKIYLSPSAEFDVEISGGNLSEVVIWNADTTNTARNPSGFITGGTFTKEPENEFVAEGFEVNENANGSFGVDVKSVPVYTYDELVAALNVANAKVILMDDITGTATAGGYNLAGIVVETGDVVDGNGKKLTINGANGTWDCAIAMTGGTVKNLTIAGAMRGVFMPGANGDVVIDSCAFEDVIYTFNSDAGNANYSVTIKDTVLNGWTSFSNVHKSVTFDGCTFGEGSGYAFLRPYQSTTFVNCSFAEGYEFDTKATGDNTLSFNDCTYNGAPISNENNELFYAGGSVLVDGKELNMKKGTWGGIDWTLIEGTLTIAPTKGEPELNPNVNDGQTRYAVGAWRENVVYKNGEAASIGGAPYDMKAVSNLIIEEGVISIGSFTAQFPNLTGEVVIPSTVEYIGQEAFQKAPMTKLTFAAGGTEELCIAQGAFKNLIIEEVSLPSDRPVHLHAWVFNNCHNLKNATIPATLVSVHGTNHIDYFDDFEEHSNPTWTKASEIFAYNENMETIVFENEEVRDMFYANNNGTTKDYLVATVGLTTYGSFDAAFESAKDGDTIKLVNNVTLDKSYKFAAGKTITLDLNGKTITGKDNNTSGNFYLFDNRGNLTIKGNGKITLTAVNNRQWNASSVVVANNPGGKLVIENGTIEHLGGTDMAYGVDNLTNGKNTYAETVVNGGTIKSTYRAIRQFLNGVEAQNILTVNGGTVEGTNKAIWMQDPSKNANSGTITVGENAVVNGDVYLSVTAGSTEWPVTVSIAASALNGEVLTSNVPLGLDVVANNGIYGVVRISPDVYTVTAVADKTEVRYNNDNTADTFTVDYIVTGGNVIGAMAQFRYDNTLFTCADDTDNDGVVRMSSRELTTDAEGKTLLKTLTFTVAKNPDVTTTYTFKAEHVQVVSDFDAAGSGAQDGFVSNVVGADVTVIAQYDVTLPADGSVSGDILVDADADYTATIENYDAERDYTITYTMGGTEHKVTVDTPTFVIEDVTGDIVFVGVKSVADVEIVLLKDVINGLTLVMVKDGAGAGYTYDGATMYEVERYEGLTSVERTDFTGSILNATTVHAIFVEGAVTVDQAKAAIKATDVASVIAKDYDVNRNGQFFFNDAMTAYGCYFEQYDLDAHMTWFLSADVNTDFVVDTDDYDEAVAAFWATLV